MRLALDKTLPVALGAQLRGLIEYGIACGEIAGGARLPSVRELADEIGVAPMTVSQVYRDLKEAGLIHGRPGSGTFVTDRGAVGDSDARMAAFLQRVDALIDEGLAIGLRSGEIAGSIGARLSGRVARGRTKVVVLVGTFPVAAASYARSLASALGPGTTVEALTVDALQRREAAMQRATAADLVLTFAHRRREVAALLPHQRVAAISFIPSEDTRRGLASLDPRARVLVVSRFPEFLPVIKAGVEKFAPHVSAVTAALLDGPDLAALLGACSIVVLSTGAEAALDQLPVGVRAMEYRHVPDPGEIERIVIPLLRDPDSPAIQPDRKAS
ncbi:GntR family transcriptional regulator [Lichenihabitans psoromatis]|uniref:GntR family transcriptional regulator n=1 Tax=Lichenihabitans psoromatis TaxID=2528642 RepID=UPI0013F15C12|nr:GntR family transcriptional regulator [Lichenihabitans psoromatis]